MLFSLVALVSVSFSFEAQWQDWKALHGKKYIAEEEIHRQAIFAEHLKEIDAINARKGSWQAGLNKFSDLSWDEFKATVLMEPQHCSATHRSSGWKAPADVEAPLSKDWRDVGALGPVKDQGHCGSCWTFSTTGSMEAHHFLKYGKMLSLSEQQLVDCADAFDNHGCNGGLPSQAFEYIMYNGGHDTEESYPYTGVTGKTCLYDSKPAALVSDVVNITANDEHELYQAVATKGPVSIAFQVASDFHNYKSGVYDGECSTSPDKVNHAVVAIGYGMNGLVPYWTVRNSWGTDWGMDGHFQIKRGVNKCGLADCASFPVPA